MRATLKTFAAVAALALAVGCGTVGGLYTPKETTEATTLPSGEIVFTTNVIWSVNTNAAGTLEVVRDVAPAFPYGDFVSLGAGGLLALAGWIGKLKNAKERDRARAILQSVVKGIEAGGNAAGDSAANIVKSSVNEQALRDGTASELHAVVSKLTK